MAMYPTKMSPRLTVSGAKKDFVKLHLCVRSSFKLSPMQWKLESLSTLLY